MLSNTKRFAFTIASDWKGQEIEASQQVSLQLGWTDTTCQLSFSAPYHKDPAPSSAIGPTDQLWDYEVVELFLVGSLGDGTAVHYTEFEFSPHGHYLVLQLEGIRQVKKKCIPIQFSASIEGDRWFGKAEWDRALNPDPIQSFNAFAIHGSGEARKYSAHASVQGSQPDFHRLHLYPKWRIPHKDDQ